MKNIFLLALIISFASCKKDYTCTCTDSNGTSVIFTEKTTKEKAQKKCDDYFNSKYGNIAFPDASCKLN
jgi:hypothetical protein